MNRAGAAWLTAALVAAAAFPASALRPGDRAAMLDVRWIQGEAPPLLPIREDPRSQGAKAVVFLMTRAANRAETVQLLAEFVKDHGSELTVAAVTPDARSDAEKFLHAFPEFKIPFATDEKRSVTARYMAGSLLYPMAFLIDGDGVIVWNGEAVDLAEAYRRYRADDLPLRIQRNIAPKIDELQTLLRDLNDRRAAELTAEILRDDPGNPAALRLRLFQLERSGRADDGWKLLSSELEKSPESIRLYLMALDLAARAPELADRLDGLLCRYLEAVAPNADSDTLMAWTLLTRFPEHPEALRAAKQLSVRMIPAASNRLRAAQRTMNALLAYRLGDTAAAVALQRQALEEWRAAQELRGAADAERRLSYYETVLRLAPSEVCP